MRKSNKTYKARVFNTPKFANRFPGSQNTPLRAKDWPEKGDCIFGDHSESVFGDGEIYQFEKVGDKVFKQMGRDYVFATVNLITDRNFCPNDEQAVPCETQIEIFAEA